MFSALSVSEKLVYRFRFLALCWLACFSNIRFMPLFTLWVGTTLVPVFLWLESHVGWTEILVLILKKRRFWRRMETIQSLSLLLYYTRPKTSITAASCGKVIWCQHVHTYQEPPPQISLLWSFPYDAISTRKICKSEVHAKHYSIMVCSPSYNAWLLLSLPSHGLHWLPDKATKINQIMTYF